MAFFYGTCRFILSIVAVYLGAADWKIWWLAPVILAHTGASYLFTREMYAEVSDRLSASDATAESAAYHSTFYKPNLSREFAVAFIKCGIAYGAGFWFAQFMAAPTAAPA